ncbi:IPT/TIG domain-containing protein [Chitinophaga arvensicola]|uniref:IPT/TIG domain-containing protein n=1 Tax=Chitinophaga arvensicola TaxID=29529 RepID=A0A1I0RW15_9BACT|nr:IPT/TIG domain-containing protein [Chitinophaga arvensicola]SEW45648.1 IPT/TIG domain-containing protein [Chitinophaga arvensicola]
MTRIYIFPGLLLLALTTIIACKKDPAGTEGIIIDAVKIEKLSSSFAQAGEELTIYGSHLIQKDVVTEVFVTGRPSEVLHSSADSITIKVPLKVQTGKVMVTLSKGTKFSSAYGPDIVVRPTPLIKSFAPLFAYGGDTIELYTENFSEIATNNEIFIGTKKVQIVAGKGKDTILVKLPEDAASGTFAWHTYNGPLFKTAASFPVRQARYTANTVAQWLYQDPGYSYMDTLVRGYPDLAGGNYLSVHKTVYDTVLQYINSSGRKYTIFLPSNAAYEKNTSKAAFLEKVKNRPYNYNSMLANTIVPGENMRLADMQDGDRHPTAYTMKLAFWEYEVPTDDYNFIQIIIEDGVKYAQVWGPYDQTQPRVKILREHQVGNATIIETDGEPGVVSY